MIKRTLLSLTFMLLMALAVALLTLPSLPEEAKGNEWELKKTLLYYKYINPDRQKFDAALFLIENMKYHKGIGCITKISTGLKYWRMETDSIYASIRFSDMDMNDQRDSLNNIRKKRIAEMSNIIIPQIDIDSTPFDDIKTISFHFLKEHIDNAFVSWKESVFAKNLSFDDFKEYILPYRSIEDIGFLETGKSFKEWFGKYVPTTGVLSLRETVDSYNQAIINMRDLNGKSKWKSPTGQYDLYVNGIHDCVNIASYGCNILRACGLPVMVEYNISYKTLPGSHYHCSVWNDKKNKWESFNPESSLPGDLDWAIKEATNVYRFMYSAQKDTPYFQRNKNEFVPEILNNPCIRDVTAYLKETTKITLPFNIAVDNNLAYLATFQKENNGVIPVTWGRINHDCNSVTFENVIPNILYFPMLYSHKKEIIFFGEPFYVKKEGKEFYVSKINCSSQSCEDEGTLILTRKYPRKSKMKNIAENLVGGVFLGANKSDFSDAIVLYTIKESPAPFLREYSFDRTGKFKFYRFQASESSPYANISILEWITSSTFEYPNVMKAQRCDILSPKDTMLLKNEKKYVKLLDDLWDNMKRKSEYDGNMQTAPGAYPNITLRLKQPQIVKKVRFAPKNADNGIHSNEWYQLHFWDKDGWKSAGKVKASYEYVIFHNVPKNKLYWLENLSSGKEEMPFMMINNKQIFLYGDLIQ